MNKSALRVNNRINILHGASGDNKGKSCSYAKLSIYPTRISYSRFRSAPNRDVDKTGTQ